jgi:hypothetical protein
MNRLLIIFWFRFGTTVLRACIGTGKNAETGAVRGQIKGPKRETARCTEQWEAWRFEAQSEEAEE